MGTRAIGAAKIMLNQYQEAWDFINQDTSDKEKSI